MRMPGMGELAIILLIVVVVFGAKKLPQLGEGIGKAIKNLKRGLEREDEVDITASDQRMNAEPPASVSVHVRAATPQHDRSAH